MILDGLTIKDSSSATFAAVPQLLDLEQHGILVTTYLLLVYIVGTYLVSIKVVKDKDKAANLRRIPLPSNRRLILETPLPETPSKRRLELRGTI